MHTCDMIIGIGCIAHIVSIENLAIPRCSQPLSTVFSNMSKESATCFSARARYLRLGKQVWQGALVQSGASRMKKNTRVAPICPECGSHQI
jgi:hypothetical protein